MSVFSELTVKAFSPEKNVTCYYRVMGDSGKPAIVIFPGYTGKHIDFLQISEVLKQDYFIIILEYPGWWDSGRLSGQLTMHNYAVYAKMLIDTLGLRHATLFGHCVGSVVACEFLYLYPDTAAQTMLVSTPYLNGTPGYKGFQLLAFLADKSPKRLRPLFFLWRARLFTVPIDFIVLRTDFRRKLARMKDHLIDQPLHPEDAVEENWLSFIDFDFSKLRTIKKTVHIIHGAEDLFIPPVQAKRLQWLFPCATLNFLPHAGHVPLIEAPEELLGVVQRYLLTKTQ